MKDFVLAVRTHLNMRH